MKIVVPAEIENDVNRCVKPTLGGIGLYDDSFSLPALAKFARELADIRIVALPKDGEVPAPRKVEDVLDAGVTPPGEECSIERVAGSKAVVHALAHGPELGSHQPTGLGGSESNRMFGVLGIEPEEIADCSCSGWRSSDRTPVPT